MEIYTTKIKSIAVNTKNALLTSQISIFMDFQLNQERDSKISIQSQIKINSKIKTAINKTKTMHLQQKKIIKIQIQILNGDPIMVGLETFLHLSPHLMKFHSKINQSNHPLDHPLLILTGNLIHLYQKL